MKILLVSHFFPPLRIGGAEKRALGYALELQKKGHTVQVVCAGSWDVGQQPWVGFEDEVYMGISVRRANFNWAAASDPNQALYDNPLVEAHFEHWLEEWEPDIVHIISLITLTAGVVRSIKRRGIPIVFTLVDFWMICPKISLVHGNETLCDGKNTNRDCLKCLLWNTRAYRGLRKFLPDGLAASLLGWASRHPRISRRPGLRGMALNINERRQTMAKTARMVDCVVAPSRHLGRVVDESHVFPHPVRVVHSGHDLSWLSTAPEKRHSDAVRLGYIGQLIPTKGVHILIEAFKAAASLGKAKLLIYGAADTVIDPHYAASLQARVTPSDAIQFMGAFPNSKLGEVLAGLDVLVLPSQWHENNPRVIQEAFACKMPVIGSNVGGIAEFVQHGRNGLLFEHNSVDDLRAQIERILTEPGLIQRLADGIKPVKTIAEEMEEIIEIYQELIAEASKTKVTAAVLR